LIFEPCAARFLLMFSLLSLFGCSVIFFFALSQDLVTFFHHIAASFLSLSF